MAFSWGSALTQFGKDLPGVGAGIDDIFKQKRELKRQGMLDAQAAGKDERQAILDSLTAEEGRMGLDKMAEEKTRRGNVGETMESFTGLIKPSYKPIEQLQPNEVDFGQAFEQNTPMGMHQVPGKSLDDAVSESGILKIAGDPDAKAALDYISSKEKNAISASKGKEKTEFLSTPYEENSPEFDFAKKMVDGSLPFDSAMQLFTAMGGSSSARPRLLATAYRINPKYSVLGSLAGKAGTIKAATNLAPEKPSEKVVTDLSTTQGIFANLDAAKETFNSNYATPYAGKIIKLGWLRANDTDFAGFLTSLGLSMNEYRRQNFGTAQTDSEIQNFLDIINTDTNVRPEVFMKQLSTLTTAMKRDYENKTKNMSAAGYRVPDDLKKVNSSIEKVLEFATPEEAEAANLKPGTKIKVGGRGATWQ